MCLDYVKMSNYIDGILNIAESQLFEEHLETCQKCQITYKNYKTMIRGIGQLEMPVVSDDFADRVLLKISSIVHPSFVEISSYRDGFTQDKNVAEHIEDCIPCLDIVNSINNEVVSVSGLSDYQPSENFFDSLMSKIDDLETESTDYSDEIKEDDFLSGIMAKIEDLPELEDEHIFSEDLSAYIDGEETSVSTVDIAEHLEKCEKCNSKYVSFKFTKTAVAELINPPVPFDFSRRVIKEIDLHEESSTKKEANNIIKFIPYFRKFAPRASMVAGIIIAGILVTISRTQIDQPQEQMANITVRSEDYLFSNSTVSYRTDSLDVLVDNRQDDSLQIQDIGL